VSTQGQQLDSTALMVIGETAMQERFDIAMKANFGFCLDQNGRAVAPTAGQIRALVVYCATYGLDPLRHEVVLFGGNPLVGLDAYRRKATETGDYLGCTHKPVTSPEVKTALGYVPEDIVDECMVKRLVKGHVAEFSRYGGIRKKEMEAIAQSGGARHPIINKFPSEMAQNRAEKHALRAAFQFTFKDTESTETTIDTSFSEVGEGAPTGAPPTSDTPASESHPVSSQTAGATDDQGQSPVVQPDAQTHNGTQPPLSTNADQLSFGEPEPKPEPTAPAYTVPDSLLPSQFQFLMSQMQVTSKAAMNKLLDLKAGEQFAGSPKDAVDAVFATLVAKGGIPSDIKHWAQWLPKEG